MGGPAWWMSWVLEDMCGIIMCMGFSAKRGVNRGNNLERRVHVDGVFFGNDVVRGGKS